MHYKRINKLWKRSHREHFVDPYIFLIFASMRLYIKYSSYDILHLILDCTYIDYNNNRYEISVRKQSSIGYHYGHIKHKSNIINIVTTLLCTGNQLTDTTSTRGVPNL